MPRCCGCATFVLCPPTKVVDRETGTPVAEPVPGSARFQLGGLYGSLPGYLILKIPAFKAYLRSRSVDKGKLYDSPDSRGAIAKFVADYEIDVDEAELPVDEYKTLNEFFYRSLKPGLRPVQHPDDRARALCPADSRAVVFASVGDARRLWVKGSGFTLARLLDVGEGHAFEGGSVAIFRLAPNDYHRYHSPVAGTVSAVRPVDGEYHSVKDYAMGSSTDVLGLNKRTVVEIDTDEFGAVALVIVGALEVGSIVLTGFAEAGKRVERGDDGGYFAYGGSTVVAVFRAGAIRFDDDLLQNSSESKETLVRVKTSLGVATGGGGDDDVGAGDA